MRLKSPAQYTFSQLPDANIKRSKFNRSSQHKTTFDSGYLVPVYRREVLPGDTFNVSMTAFARLSSPLGKPIMDNMYMDTFFFFVPNRLVWDNWQRFCGERDPNPSSSIDYRVPKMTSPVGGYAIGSLSDYFGIPTDIENLTHISLYHRAYNLIYNEFFRPQDIIDSVVVDKDNGPDDPADYVLLKRVKRHDYFTSCLPWPQKGDSVLLPLGESAPVNGTGEPITLGRYGTSESLSLYAFNDATNKYRAGLWENPAANGNLIFKTAAAGDTGLIVDLSDATAATVNQLRQAFQIQIFQEKEARYGTRYTEILRSFFNVVSPDQRLQRPEVLSLGSTPVNINPIVQNSSSVAGSPQGNLSSIATITAKHGFTKSFVEHGMILGMVCIRADLSYQQGLDREFSRDTRFDYFWPPFAHLGEQAVLNKEIYAQGEDVVDVDDNIIDDQVFGYQERYSEYKYSRSLITGKFRSTASGSLDSWHLSQEFGSLPALTDPNFIEENPPIDRVIAVTSEPQIIFDSYFSEVAVRPIPVYSTPGYIDHF